MVSVPLDMPWHVDEAEKATCYRVTLRHRDDGSKHVTGYGPDLAEAMEDASRRLLARHAQVPEEMLDHMADAMIAPDLAWRNSQTPSGRPVRREVLQRSLDFALRYGWVLSRLGTTP